MLNYWKGQGSIQFSCIQHLARNVAALQLVILGLSKE